MSEREQHIFFAELAESAGRFHEMMEAMKRVAKMEEDFTNNECRLISVAFKGYLRPYRNALITFDTTERKELQKGNQDNVNIIQGYRRTIEEKIKRHCMILLELLDKHVLPHLKRAQNKVFFTKFKADFYRYIAELEKEADNPKAEELAYMHYQQASAMADKYLLPGCPVAIATGLNFSLFVNEFFSSPEKAIEISQITLDKALRCQEPLSPQQKEEATMALQLLRDNINAWKAEISIRDHHESQKSQQESVDKGARWKNDADNLVDAAHEHRLSKESEQEKQAKRIPGGGTGAHAPAEVTERRASKDCSNDAIQQRGTQSNGNSKVEEPPGKCHQLVDLNDSEGEACQHQMIKQKANTAVMQKRFSVSGSGVEENVRNQSNSSDETEEAGCQKRQKAAHSNDKSGVERHHKRHHRPNEVEEFDEKAYQQRLIKERANNLIQQMASRAKKRDGEDQHDKNVTESNTVNNLKAIAPDQRILRKKANILSQAGGASSSCVTLEEECEEEESHHIVKARRSPLPKEGASHSNISEAVEQYNANRRQVKDERGFDDEIKLKSVLKHRSTSAIPTDDGTCVTPVETKRNQKDEDDSNQKGIDCIVLKRGSRKTSDASNEKCDRNRPREAANHEYKEMLQQTRDFKDLANVLTKQKIIQKSDCESNNDPEGNRIRQSKSNVCADSAYQERVIRERANSFAIQRGSKVQNEDGDHRTRQLQRNRSELATILDNCNEIIVTDEFKKEHAHALHNQRECQHPKDGSLANLYDERAVRGKADRDSTIASTTKTPSPS